MNLQMICLSGMNRLSAPVLGGIILTLILLTDSLFAQTAQSYKVFPPLDCKYSVPVCTTGRPIIQNKTLNFSVPGSVPNEIDTAGTCLKSGDKDGFWYDFNVVGSGDLVFFILPRNNPGLDLDWILFRSPSGLCSDLIPVLCNYAKDVTGGGITGIDPAVSQSGDQDLNGSALVKPIRLLQGNRYFLYINSKPPFPQEYELNFTGTFASFGANPEPNLKAIINTTFNCGEKRLFLEFDRPIARFTMDPGDFEVVTPQNQVIAVTRIAEPANDAALNEYSAEIETAVPFTQTGTYILRIKGTLADVCNREMKKGDVPFFIDRLTLPIDAGNNQSVCAGVNDSIQLSAKVPGFENQPNIIWQWTPDVGLGNARIANPRALVRQTITYSVTARLGDCVSPSDTLKVSVLNPNNARIQGRTGICRGERITLTGIGADQFRWVELNVTTHQITDFPTQNPTTYTAIPTTGNCVGNPIRFTVNLFDRPDATFTVPDTVCLLERINVEYNGNLDRAFRKFTFDSSAFIVSGSRLGPYEFFFTQPGDRYIKLEATANGCINPNVKRIFVRPLPKLDMGETVFLCSDEGKEIPVQFNFSPGCRFNWLPTAGLTNPNILRPFARPARTTTYTLSAVCPCGTLTDTVSVVLNPVVSANPLRANVPYCEGSSGAVLRTRVEGGSGTYDFKWSPEKGLDNPFSQNPNATPASVTTYTLIVTDNRGCVAEPAFITVTPQKIPYADAGSDKLICFDDDGVDLIGHGYGDRADDSTYTFTWSPAEGLSTPTGQVTHARPTQTTIYTLTVSNNSTGCSSALRPVNDTSTVVVEVVKPPVASAGPDKTICYEGRTLIGDVPWELDSNYRYFWQPAIGLDDPFARRPIASPRVTTTYFLTIISLNCRSFSDTVIVNVIPAPKPYASVNYIDLCPGDSVQLKAFSGITTSDSSLVSYVWTPAEGLSNAEIADPIAKPGRTITYSVSAIFRNCRVNFDTVRVNVVPLPKIIADNNFREGFIICRGDTFTIPAKYIGEEPFSVEWSPADSVLDTFSRQPRVNPLITTRFYLTLTKSGCKVIDSVDIKVAPAIRPVITADRDTVCEGDSVNLTVQGGTPFTRFTWVPATYTDSLYGRSVEFRPPYTQDVTVIAEDAGCIQSAKFRVHIIPLPKAAFDFNIENACADYRVHFTDKSDSAVFHVWDFGDGTELTNGTNPTHVYTAPGSYTVRLRAMYFFPCEKEIAANRTFNLYPRADPKITFSPDDTVMLPFSTVEFTDTNAAKSRGVSNRLWTVGNESYREGEKMTYRFLKSGLYPVVLAVTDSGGCITRDTVYITVLEPTMRVPNVFTPNNDGVNDGWTVNYDGQEKYTMLIFDRWGQLVFESENQNTAWNGRLNNTGSDSPEGTYFFQMKIGKKIYRGDITLLR